MQLDPKLRFDNYIVGSGNRLAVAAARAVADAPGTVYNPLFIYSGSGLGKTHLMGAIGNHVAQRHPATTVRAVTLDDILNELHAAMARGETDRLRQRYQNVGMLLIDDVQFLTGHTETQSELLRILNVLQAAKNQIVMTSDRPPSEIKDVDDRLVTRMSGGLIVDISAPDYETRTAILHSKCEERGVHFRSGVMEELGRLEFRNVRELQGALNRLIAVQAMSGDDSVRPTDVLTMLGSLATTAAAPRRSSPSYPPPVPVDTAPFETTKPSWRTQLRSAIDHWSSEGYSTASLERAVNAATPPTDVDALLRDYQDAVAKLRELSRACAEADQALASNEVFFDPDRVGDAQAAARADEAGHHGPARSERNLHPGRLRDGAEQRARGQGRRRGDRRAGGEIQSVVSAWSERRRQDAPHARHRQWVDRAVRRLGADRRHSGAELRR